MAPIGTQMHIGYYNDINFALCHKDWGIVWGVFALPVNSTSKLLIG